MIWPFIARCLEVATIFLFAGIGELLNQRSGVLNVGIEGLMLFGGASGFMTAIYTGNLLLAFVIGTAVGGTLGLLHGLLSITLKVDQVLSGMGIWIFAMGFVTWWADRYTGRLPEELSPFRIKGLLSPLFFFAVALIFVAWFVLSKTHLGLKIRSVGEDPSVAEATGISVIKIRYLCTTMGGLLGGLAGAFMVLIYLGLWGHIPTQGMGWIALALVFFSMWRPILLLTGALVFGVIWQFGISPEVIIPGGLGIPLAIYRVLPFIVTIIVLVVISTPKFRRKWGLAKPASLGLPYIKE